MDEIGISILAGILIGSVITVLCSASIEAHNQVVVSKMLCQKLHNNTNEYVECSKKDLLTIIEEMQCLQK